MPKPSASNASDYATLHAENATFYFGYEETWCPEHGFRDDVEGQKSCDGCDTEWCFVAKLNGETVRVQQSKLGASDKWDCRENLLMGIGWVLTKWRVQTEATPRPPTTTEEGER